MRLSRIIESNKHGMSLIFLPWLVLHNTNRIRQTNKQTCIWTRINFLNHVSAFIYELMLDYCPFLVPVFLSLFFFVFFFFILQAMREEKSVMWAVIKSVSMDYSHALALPWTDSKLSSSQDSSSSSTISFVRVYQALTSECLVFLSLSSSSNCV